MPPVRVCPGRVDAAYVVHAQQLLELLPGPRLGQVPPRPGQRTADLPQAVSFVMAHRQAEQRDRSAPLSVPVDQVLELFRPLGADLRRADRAVPDAPTCHQAAEPGRARLAARARGVMQRHLTSGVDRDPATPRDPRQRRDLRKLPSSSVLLPERLILTLPELPRKIMPVVLTCSEGTYRVVTKRGACGAPGRAAHASGNTLRHANERARRPAYASGDAAPRPAPGHHRRTGDTPGHRRKRERPAAPAERDTPAPTGTRVLADATRGSTLRASSAAVIRGTRSCEGRSYWHPEVVTPDRPAALDHVPNQNLAYLRPQQGRDSPRTPGFSPRNRRKSRHAERGTGSAERPAPTTDPRPVGR